MLSLEELILSSHLNQIHLSKEVKDGKYRDHQMCEF